MPWTASIKTIEPNGENARITFEFTNGTETVTVADNFSDAGLQARQMYCRNWIRAREQKDERDALIANPTPAIGPVDLSGGPTPEEAAFTAKVNSLRSDIQKLRALKVLIDNSVVQSTNQQVVDQINKLKSHLAGADKELLISLIT